MRNEIEAKFLSIDKRVVRRKLKEAGFDLKTPEYLMRRKTFDFSNNTSEHKKWGRVRQESDRVTMAIKEIRGAGINDTYETELVVNDFDTATIFFEACGILAKAFQENTREIWIRDGVEATIDTWPGLKPFVEIEGVNEDIVKKASSELGFSFEQAVFGSIDFVYEKELGVSAKTIIRLPEITFENPPNKNAA